MPFALAILSKMSFFTASACPPPWCPPWAWPTSFTNTPAVDLPVQATASWAGQHSIDSPQPNISTILRTKPQTYILAVQEQKTLEFILSEI